MSDPLAALVVSLLASALILTIAILIRVRGPVGLVKNVDWRRVSDPQGLGQFVSLMMTLIAALIAAHGVLIYAIPADRPTRNIGSVVFAALMIVLAIATLIGQQRYHDKPREDGRR